MGDRKSDTILQTPIDHLDVSVTLKAMCAANGYRSLSDLLEEPLHTIPFRTQSGYRILHEVLMILENHDLAYLADDW
ncbi:MAG: hypothetical protein KF763_15350 [Cyclobacteriaceae bacterium]|nr:hypothetical protein [Cyclobacteriaceae bacterium]